MSAQSPELLIDHWLQYIECAKRHPRPLPEGSHAYNPNLHTIPEVQELYHCLYKLYHEESCSVNFREPVNALSLNIFKYYEVVQTPMSLRTILDRIAAGGYYSNVTQVMKDIDQTWENCRLFNGASSPITAEAHRCEERLKSIRRSYAEEQPASEDQQSWLSDSVGNCTDEVVTEISNFFSRDYPDLLDNEGAIDLTKLKVKHINAIRLIIDRNMPKA